MLQLIIFEPLVVQNRETIVFVFLVNPTFCRPYHSTPRAAEFSTIIDVEDAEILFDKTTAAGTDIRLISSMKELH